MKHTTTLKHTTTMTTPQFFTLCLIDLRGEISATGMHRVIHTWDTDECDKILLKLHKGGLVEKAMAGGAAYRLTPSTKAHIEAAHTLMLPEKSVPTQSKPRVMARLEDKENVFGGFDFDCTAWFDQADDTDLRDLIDEGFGDGYTSDSVALFFDGKNDAITEVYVHPRRGTMCSVNKEQAVAWMGVHRPEVARHRPGDDTTVFPDATSNPVPEAT